MWVQNSGMEKAFLFDVVSKIYVATDSNPVEPQAYELSADMIDVVIDVSCIYGCAGDCVGRAAEGGGECLAHTIACPVA